MSELDDLFRTFEAFDRMVVDGFREAVREATTQARDDARSKYHWKNVTGETASEIASAIRSRVNKNKGGATGVVRATGENLMRLAFGTPPHTIRPKFAAGFRGPTRQSQGRRDVNDVGTHRVALRWTDGGGTHFAKQVQHPGTQPDPWLNTAAEAAGAVLEQRARDAVEKALRSA